MAPAGPGPTPRGFFLKQSGARRPLFCLSIAQCPPTNSASSIIYACSPPARLLRLPPLCTQGPDKRAHTDLLAGARRPRRRRRPRGLPPCEVPHHRVVPSLVPFHCPRQLLGIFCVPHLAVLLGLVRPHAVPAMARQAIKSPRGHILCTPSCGIARPGRPSRKLCTCAGACPSATHMHTLVYPMAPCNTTHPTFRPPTHQATEPPNLSTIPPIGYGASPARSRPPIVVHFCSIPPTNYGAQ